MKKKSFHSRINLNLFNGSRTCKSCFAVVGGDGLRKLLINELEFWIFCCCLLLDLSLNHLLH